MPEVVRSYRGVPAAERRQQRRRLLLDACLDIVGRDGTPAVTAESVSAAAKLTKRYFYESFADRDAVLVAALDELFDDLAAQLRDASLPAERDERARAVAEIFVSVMCHDPRRARLYAESPALPALNERREVAVAAFTDVIVTLAATGPDDGIDRRLVARMIVAGAADLVTNWLAGNIAAQRAMLIEAMVAVGRTLGFAAPGTPTASQQTRNAHHLNG